MTNLITYIIPRLEEVNDVVTKCSGDAMSYGQALTVTRFYFDYEDTNAIIEEAEVMATGNTDALKEIAQSLKAGTSMLIDNINRLDKVDFRSIAKEHSEIFHDRFQEASDALNPYWKRYCLLNNRLDYLPFDSEEYAATEKECEAAKIEHDARQVEVKKIYAEYERESRESGYVFMFKPSHMLALATKLNGIAGSIIADLDRLEKGSAQ